MLLRTIEVPKYIREVMLSRSRRPEYYHKDKGRKIPKKYMKELPSGKYFFNGKGFLVNNETGKRIVSNSSISNKPRYVKLSGNRLITGFGSPHVRNKIVNSLKDFYAPFVREHLQEYGPITQFPLRVEWDFHTVIEDKDKFDASNLFFYYKYFEDALFKDFDGISLIPDDNIRYVTHPPGPKIIPIENDEDRKFVFRFYYDDRAELKRSPWV